MLIKYFKFMSRYSREFCVKITKNMLVVLDPKIVAMGLFSNIFHKRQIID